MAHEPDNKLDETLDSLTPAEPPADLTPAVMREVSASAGRLSAWQRWRRAARAREVANFSTRQRVDSQGVVMGKKLLWSVAGVAAVLVVSFTFFGFPQIGPGTEGTSGGAQRYVGKQLSAKDVKVADTDVQRFIQSDTFDRLIRNDVTRKAIVKAFSDPVIAAALQNPQLVLALRDENVRQSLSNPQILMALADPQFRKNFADLELAQALAGDDEMFAALSTLELQKAIKNKHLLDAMQLTDVEELLANEAIATLLKKPLIAEALADERAADLFAELGKSLKNKAVISALESPDFEAALNEPVIEAALGKGVAFQAFTQEPGVAAALAKHPGAKGAFADLAFLTALSDDDIRNAFEDDGIRAMLIDADFIAAMQDDQIIEAMHHPAFAMMMADDELMRAFSTPGVLVALSEPEIFQAFQNPSFAMFMAEHGELIAALGRAGFADVLAEPAFVLAMSDLALANVFQDGDVLTALSDVQFVMELGNADGLPKAFADLEARAQFSMELAGKKK